MDPTYFSKSSYLGGKRRRKRASKKSAKKSSRRKSRKSKMRRSKGLNAF